MSVRARAVPRRRARITGRAAVLAALVAALLAAGVVPVRRYMEQRTEIEALEAQVVDLMGERAELEHQLERLRDPEYLEYLARKCLGMVKEGEIKFVAVPEGGESRPADC
jgi:cell division protein FtsB